MCNFSEGIEERGIIKGKKEGIKEGIKALVATLEDLNIATEIIRSQVMSRFGLTEKELKEYL